MDPWLPVRSGGPHSSVTVPSPVCARSSSTTLGRSGFSAGVADTLAAGPSPTPFTACTSKAYCVSLTSPVTVTPVSSAVLPPESVLSGTSIQAVFEGTVVLAAYRYRYLLMAEPPVLDGAAHDSVTCASPTAASRFCGAPGSVGSAMLVEPVPASDHAPSPSAFAARTRTSYDVSSARLAMLAVVTVPACE